MRLRGLELIRLVVGGGGELVLFVAYRVVEGFTAVTEEFTFSRVVRVLDPNRALLRFCREGKKKPKGKDETENDLFGIGETKKSPPHES